MDDVDLKIAAMEKELTELRIRINSLGERLGHGENAVRADLNPAIRRERALSSELRDLKVASGRVTADDLSMVQAMYGPPAVRRGQPFAQQDEATRTPDDIGKVPGIWRRLFGRK